MAIDLAAGRRRAIVLGCAGLGLFSRADKRRDALVVFDDQAVCLFDSGILLDRTDDSGDQTARGGESDAVGFRQ